MFFIFQMKTFRKSSKNAKLIMDTASSNSQIFRTTTRHTLPILPEGLPQHVEGSGVADVPSIT
jgi:hypothetical protein